MTMTLSAVVASKRAVPLLDACLAALAPQCAALNAQLIVARAGGVATLPSEIRRRYPLMTVVDAPSDSAIPQLRGIGLGAATGELVALTEDHCVPQSNWLAALMRAAEHGADVVGGGMGNARTRPVDWAAYFSEYGFFAFTRPPADGEVLITGANVAYSGRIVEDVGRWAREGAWENTIHHRLAADGCRMRFVPNARVDQNLAYKIGAFSLDRYEHGRDYAKVRVERASTGARLRHLMLCPLLPIVLARRLVHAAWRVDRPAFVRALPITLMFLSAWAAGEASGYAAGLTRRGGL